jgi:hypothetical protein
MNIYIYIYTYIYIPKTTDHYKHRSGRITEMRRKINREYLTILGNVCTRKREA